MTDAVCGLDNPRLYIERFSFIDWAVLACILNGSRLKIGRFSFMVRTVLAFRLRWLAFVLRMKDDRVRYGVKTVDCKFFVVTLLL